MYTMPHSLLLNNAGLTVVLPCLSLVVPRFSVITFGIIIIIVVVVVVVAVLDYLLY